MSDLANLTIGDCSSGESPYSNKEALDWIHKARTEGPQVFEWLARKRNGDLFWAEIVAKSTDITGEGRVLAVLRDISERKNAEQVLRQKEEQQALILRTLPMAFYVAQPFGDYGGTWVSEQIETLTGFSQDQFMADLNIWWNRIHPEDRLDTLDTFEKIHKVGSVSVEYRWQIADGSYRWFHDEGVLINDEGGNPKEIIGSWLDITERKNEQEALLITQHTVDHNALPILWVNPQSSIKYANQAACNLLGYTLEEMANMPLGFANPEGSPNYWDVYLPLLKERGALEFEVDLKKKDGTIFPAIATPTYLEFMGKEYVVVNLLDLSDRKRMEKELQQAQKMEAIGTLAGGIAHDFNNILFAIFGYTELAKMDINEPDQLQNDLQEINQGAERAKDLVRQILTFSRKTEIEKHPLQLSLIVKEALKLLRPSIPTSIEIKQNVRSKSLTLADPTQMHQVIMNLCTNAYHAMKDSRGTITISLADVEVDKQFAVQYPDMKAGSYLKLSVEDTGYGMDRDTREKIFEPYFTTKEQGEGTGLGLAVVHGIVKQCGGLITCRSEPGQGTCFDVYLPVYVQDHDEDAPKTDEQDSIVGTEAVMFVDDEEHARQLATRVFEKYGYNLTAFANGLDAWQDYNSHPDKYDIIVTDLTMPKMNGVELAKNILQKTPGKPIVLCTGYSDTINREKAIEIGIAEFIIKPVEMSVIAKTVHDLLHGES